MRKFLSLLILFVSASLMAQSGNTVPSILPVSLMYAVLPDSNYSLAEVRQNGDRGLPFIPNGYLRPSKHPFYWIKINIANPGHFAGEYIIDVRPHLLNSYYYFDVNTQTWVQQTAGILTASNNGRTKEVAMHLLMQPAADNVVYVRMDISQLQPLGITIQPTIQIENQLVFDKVGKTIWDGWLVAVAVLFFFFLGNLYQYAIFKDSAVLFYLLTQLGAMLYITTYRRFLSWGMFTHWVGTDGTVRYYGSNHLLMHAGILLLLYGFVQLCRVYLQTKQYLPLADRILQWGLYSYMLLSIVLMVINTSFFYLERHTLLYDNIFLLLLILTMGYTCFAAYRLKLRASGTFFIALMLPLVIMVTVPIFYLFINVNGDSNLWLPNLALVSDAVLFSAALVTRTKLILNELKTKQLEAKQLEIDLLEVEFKRNLIEMENQQINSDMLHEKSRYGLLQEKLDTNQRELASTAMHMVQKNELLARLTAEIAELKKLSVEKHGGSKKEFSSLEQILKSNQRFDDDWGKFKLHFEQVHPHFFEKLESEHPSLTKNETRLLAYFHINLSTKEIASLLNIAPTSVRQAKMRLYKKMGTSSSLSVQEEDGGE